MDVITLTKGNDLNRKISEFQEVLNCFEWQPYSDEERVHEAVSTNPKLIIDFDGCDGREQLEVPMNLNAQFIHFLKTEIKKALDETVQEFIDLKC